MMKIVFHEHLTLSYKKPIDIYNIEFIQFFNISAPGNNLMEKRFAESIMYIFHSNEVPLEIRVKDRIYLVASLNKIKASDINAAIKNKIPSELTNNCEDLVRCHRDMLIVMALFVKAIIIRSGIVFSDDDTFQFY